MLRHRSIRQRPEHPSRRVPLQHINAADARRDARIAASKAFALSRERSDSETPDMFLDPYPVPPPAAVTDVAIPRHRSPAAAPLQPRHSIRFVRQASPSNDFGPHHMSEAEECSFSPSSSLYPDSKSCLGLGLHESHRPAGRQATPTSLGYHSTHKTWNGTMLNNKENIQGNGDTTNHNKASDAASSVPSYPASTVVGAAISSAGLSSRSFLRAQPRRASIYFSGNDDDPLFLCGKPAEGTTRSNPSAVRLRRKSEVHMKKSLRRSRSSLGSSRPLTPNASLQPNTTVVSQDKYAAGKPVAEKENEAAAASGGGEGLKLDSTPGADMGSGTAGSGMQHGTDNKGLRKTASKMSKKVKSRFRGLWGHSKSEACAGELPEQHIQARRSHGSLPSGLRFCSEDSGRQYSASNLSATMDNSKAGTVVISRDENGTLPGSQCGGETSRFTSWSSSVQRTCSNASHRASVNDYERQQLPAISESGDPLHQQQKQPSHDENMSLLVSGLTRSRQQQQQQQQQQPDIRAVPAPSPSTSSPSLAGSGRGSTPRPVIAPEALQRLQELSLDLQRACYDDDVDKSGQALDAPKKDVLYAFRSDPTTPARAAKATSPSPAHGKGSEQSTPPFCFRGQSPFRRALRASMNSFEEQTAARRTSARGDANDDDDDEPLLHPSGARQWSRVQAWQEGLKHRNNSSSSVSASHYSQRSPAASRPQRLEQLHSDTAVTPEQVRLWTSPVPGSGRGSSPWETRRHARERAELGEDDLEDGF